MDDVKDVDPEFLSRFEEEFKEHQDSVRKKKRARSFRHRKGSQTPGPSSLTTPQRRKKRKRPHSTKQEKGEQLPNVAWGTPRKDEEDPPHKEENTDTQRTHRQRTNNAEETENTQTAHREHLNARGTPSTKVDRARDP